jgi:hypothetical protein
VRSEQEAAIFAYYRVIGEEQDEEDVQIQFEVKSDAEGGSLCDHRFCKRHPTALFLT